MNPVSNLPKLLITGGTGFLGKRAAAHFRSLGYAVLTPSRQELDILDAAGVLRWFQAYKPEAVLHCAAVSDTGACEKDPESTALVNVEGSCHLAAACRHTGAKLILCSSDQVYSGSRLPGPHEEGEAVTPGNVYGRQKLLAEQRCADLCPDTVSLRLSWMYDVQQDPGEHGQLLSSLRAALQDPGLPLTWPVHDRRGITDVRSVVCNLPKVLTLPAGVYNFGSENDASTYHTLKQVFETLALTDALNRLTPNTDAFAACPRDIRMDTKKAQSAGIVFDSTAAGLCRALNG